MLESLDKMEQELSLIHIQMCIRDRGGIAPGTKWEDVPEDFECPLCNVGKDQFSEVEQKPNLVLNTDG